LLTLILFVIVAMFIAYEAVAHFVFRNAGMETLSHLIAKAEHKWGTPVRIIVGAAVVVLGIHLEGVF
jgi:hypothetical protein